MLLLVGLGLTGRVLLYDAGLADVEGVEVTGTTTIPVDVVTGAAAVTPGSPLASVDTGGIAARVAALPAVASVDVDLSWPHTVSIEVVERVPVAVAQTPQGPMPVDRTGVAYPSAQVPDLPRLAFGAAGPDDPATQAALAVLTALPEHLRALVRTLDVTVAAPGVPGQVTLALTEDRQVRWGVAERAADKAAALTALLTRPGRVYDVTSPDLPTVRR